MKNIKLKKIIDSAECRENTAFPWKTRRKKTGETGFFSTTVQQMVEKKQQLREDLVNFHLSTGCRAVRLTFFSEYDIILDSNEQI